MKYIKNFLKAALMLTVIFLFTSTTPLKVEAAVDCSDVKKLHKKLLCKSGKDVSSDDATSTKKVKKAKKKKAKLKEKGQGIKKSVKSWNEENSTLVDLIKNSLQK